MPPGRARVDPAPGAVLPQLAATMGASVPVDLTSILPDLRRVLADILAILADVALARTAVLTILPEVTHVLTPFLDVAPQLAQVLPQLLPRGLDGVGISGLVRVT